MVCFLFWGLKVYICLKKTMNKLFHFLIILGTLSMLSSCFMIDVFTSSVFKPMNIDGTNANITEIPVDTDKIRMEIIFEEGENRCLILLKMPDDCEINKDSLDITFDAPNYRLGIVGSGELNTLRKRRQQHYHSNSKINPTHFIEFGFFKGYDATTVQTDSILMYLKMSGVCVKNGKSLINDTVKVNIPKDLRFIMAI